VTENEYELIYHKQFVPFITTKTVQLLVDMMRVSE